MATYRCPQCGKMVKPNPLSRAKDYCSVCGAEFIPLDLVNAQLHQRRRKLNLLWLSFTPGAVFGFILGILLLSTLFALRPYRYSGLVFIGVILLSIALNIIIANVVWKNIESQG